MLEQVFVKNVISKQDTTVREELYACRDIQVIMSDVPNIVIEEKGFVVVDFGQEMCGRLHVLSVNNAEGEIRVRLGESVAECYAELGEFEAGNYHSVRDCRLPALSNADVTTSESGFRFARIDVLSGGTFHIRNLYVESKRFALENEGYFVSNDETVNRIYEVAKHTLSLCIQNGVVWDGIKRDRTVWTGDFHPELLSITSVYGCIPEIENSLDIGETYVAKGAWINYVPAYSAWWVICLNDYYRYYGKAGYVGGKIASVKKILSMFASIVLSDGTIDYGNAASQYYTNHKFFLDWPTNETEDSYYGWISLLIHACREAKKLLLAFDEDVALADDLLRRLLKNEVVDSAYKQVEALQFLTGRKEGGAVKDALLKDGANGMTGFMGYYILTAAAAAGGGNAVLPMLKDFYGGMLQMGATSFWEDFDVQWLKGIPQDVAGVPQDGQKNIHRDYGQFCYKGLRHSLCHGWTSGVLAFFVRTVLGVKPITPGGSKIQIKPNLIGLTSVEGRVPTLYGDIYVKHTVVNGEVFSEVTLPQGVEICNEETDIY
ncbi:MAG: hypothetical protein J6S04_06900 [Clostridia bacterium]|nr:hypothetical protein [Clostridia bacterium]